jgi:sugar fermentation stimulation protein A
VRFFTNDREALFVRRPNRFVIIAKDPKTNEEIRCHCPNPGRLLEFLFPGERLILEKRRNADGHATAWTAAAIYHRGAPVPLFAARANRAAAELILTEIIPGLKTVRSEYTLGDSRFDFLCVDEAETRHLVEVKACSLVEFGVALFPDAPSVRATKHLEELAALSAQGYRAHALFVIEHGAAKYFAPNPHTDPAFASALYRLGWAGAEDCPAGKVAVHAAEIRCDSQGDAVLARPRVPVDLSFGALAEENRGSYLIVLELKESRNIEVGSLGVLPFRAGWYVYCGSAMKNLSQRVSRHLRKVRKGIHWHLDYLTPWASSIQGLPVRSRRNLECEFAVMLALLGGEGAPSFGCSDCRCDSHLYYFAEPPLKNRAFVEEFLRFQMGRKSSPVA